MIGIIGPWITLGSWLMLASSAVAINAIIASRAIGGSVHWHLSISLLMCIIWIVLYNKTPDSISYNDSRFVSTRLLHFPLYLFRTLWYGMSIRSLCSGSNLQRFGNFRIRIVMVMRNDYHALWGRCRGWFISCVRRVRCDRREARGNVFNWTFHRPWVWRRERHQCGRWAINATVTINERQIMCKMHECT